MQARTLNGSGQSSESSSGNDMVGCFSLSDVREFYVEKSFYGASVPILLNNGESVINELAEAHPGLTTFNNMDLSPYSWIAVACSGMINLKDLSLVSGKAAWMAYLDIYYLDADGALFDAALLSAVAAFTIIHWSYLVMYMKLRLLFPVQIYVASFTMFLLVVFYFLVYLEKLVQIPAVSLNNDGKIVVVSEENGGKLEKDAVNKERMKLMLKSIPFSLTCVLHKNYILADPTAEEESIMETIVTVVLDSSSQLVSLYKPGGPVLAYTSAIQHCVALTRQRMKELQKILDEANSGMEVD
nr:exosome complex component rrp43 [Quercus suber]